MEDTRRVALELLRKGPAHNQLLSPLTEYLGLCGNFGATTLNVPWEHEQFISKVRELYYPSNGSADVDHEQMQRRQDAINGVAREMAALLGSVPGLAHGINGSPKSGAPTLTHLRLVISAAELAMLPFELSKNIAGVPGGQENWLSLHTSSPVCITRHVRNVTHRSIKWPARPKILFIAASPSGKIPLKSHLQALIAAVKPWVKHFDAEDPQEIQKNTGEILTVLPDASMDKIIRACSENNYTHIHILAHGAEDTKSEGNPFGIALHDFKNHSKVEVVTGTRLATAICPFKDHPGPAVVTIASCNSGNTNSVVHSTGASFAHDLHKEGIPLIIASQYPLTFSGSIMLVEEIYGNLLWGADPLKALHNLRTKLYALKSNDNHDWASLVAYECLGDNMKDELTENAYLQVRLAIDRILDSVDQRIENCMKNKTVINSEFIESSFRHLDAVTKKFPESEAYQPEILGLLGSAEKRKAECFYKTGSLEESYKALLESRSFYDSAINKALLSRSNSKLQNSSHWLITQYLVLCAVLRCPCDNNLWHTAIQAAQTDVRFSKDQVVWAHGSLAELYLLLLTREENELPVSIVKDEIITKAKSHVEKIKELTTADNFPIHSTSRQLRRHLNWWWKEDFQAVVSDKSCNKLSRRYDELIECAEELVNTLWKRC